MSLGLASASLLGGVGALTTEIATASAVEWPVDVYSALFWVLAFGGIALDLLRLTVATFDPFLGRVREGQTPTWAGRRDSS